jgi:hypothetical protein
MSQLKDPPSMKFFLAAYGGDPGLLSEVTLELSREFRGGILGEPDIVSEDFPLTETSYYAPEMGTNLLKRYLSFENLLPPGLLVDLKHFAIEREGKYSPEGRRLVNLDPGYVFAGGLVLSTGKFSGHRLYLGRGVWGELTLLYRRGAFEGLPWTYRDYLSPGVQIHLGAMRRKYFAQNHKKGPAEGQA